MYKNQLAGVLLLIIIKQNKIKGLGRWTEVTIIIIIIKYFLKILKIIIIIIIQLTDPLIP